MIRLTALVITLTASIAPFCTAQTVYTITNIGAFPGDFSNTPVAINDAGQIVGITTRATGHGTFLWDSVNGLQDIPGVPGP
ncbi:MAG: hypothetical protein AAFU65_18500, partial [Pseudomonadota bacterium]